MPSVVLLAGSPSYPSRSTTLLDRASTLLLEQSFSIQWFSLTDFPAEDLIQANWKSVAVHRFIDAIANSHGLIVATPVYKAAYSGALKTVLDLLPEQALDHKAALALATGGSSGHLLTLEYALQPILSALKARHIINGVYATDRDFQRQDDGSYLIAEDINQRLQNAVERFITHLPTVHTTVELHPTELNKRIHAARIGI